jgi:hypothetical protein
VFRSTATPFQEDPVTDQPQAEQQPEPFYVRITGGGAQVLQGKRLSRNFGGRKAAAQRYADRRNDMLTSQAKTG